MAESAVRQLLAGDRWTVLEATGPDGPATLRFREPVLGGGGETAGYPRCLRILWGYAEEGLGALPDSDSSERLEEFENHLCTALERDALAVLTAVLTLDGARQWVFYTSDVRACGARINDMPPREEPYPIEIDAFSDPDWEYLREQIIASVRDV